MNSAPAHVHIELLGSEGAQQEVLEHLECRTAASGWEERRTVLEISIIGDCLLVVADSKDALIPGGDAARIPHIARAYMDPEALKAFEFLNRVVGGVNGVRVTEPKRASE